MVQIRFGEKREEHDDFRGERDIQHPSKANHISSHCSLLATDKDWKSRKQRSKLTKATATSNSTTRGMRGQHRSTISRNTDKHK